MIEGYRVNVAVEAKESGVEAVMSERHEVARKLGMVLRGPDAHGNNAREFEVCWYTMTRGEAQAVSVAAQAVLWGLDYSTVEARIEHLPEV